MKDLYYSAALQKSQHRRLGNSTHPYVMIGTEKHFFTEQIACGKKPLTSNHEDNVFVGSFFISKIKYK